MKTWTTTVAMPCGNQAFTPPTPEAGTGAWRLKSLKSRSIQFPRNSLNLGDIKAIKIDTEGAEFRVVQGAAGRLAQGTVSLVICEHHQFALEALGANVSDLLRFFYTRKFEGYISSDGIQFREIPVDANFKPSSQWTEEHRERAENIFFVNPALFTWPEVLRLVSSRE